MKSTMKNTMKRIVIAILLTVNIGLLNACTRDVVKPTEEDLINAIPDWVVDYSLDGLVLHSDVSELHCIEIEDLNNENKSCVARCEVFLEGDFIDRVLYVDFSCEWYDQTGWEITGAVEYQKEKIIINELPYYGFGLDSNDEYSCEQDNTTYDNEIFDVLYKSQTKYAFASVERVIEVYGSIKRENSQLGEYCEYTVSSTVDEQDTKNYLIDYQKILGTWANEEYCAWALDIEEMNETSIRWVALRYDGYEDNIVSGEPVGCCCGNSSWRFDEDDETVYMDIRMKYSYESKGWYGMDTYDEDYTATIQIPVTSNEEEIKVKVVETKKGFDGDYEEEDVDTLWRYEQDLGYLYKD